MNRIIKVAIFLLLVKPLILVILGLNVRNRKKLPKKGPAIIIANHNSHLDVMVLMSLYPLSKIHKVRPVAAADYFFKNKFISWISKNCLGIIPITRKGGIKIENLFDGCHEALDNQDILIIFPEGSRGNPERIGKIKKGVFYLAKGRNDDVAIIPVLMRGLGMALPRGEALFVPVNCDVVVGDRLPNFENSREFVEFVEKDFKRYAQLNLHHQ